MKFEEKLLSDIKNSIEIKKKIILKKKNILRSINLIYAAIKKKKKILICGNGGSAADAQHLSAEFIDRLKPDINRKPLPLLSLALDTSHLTACGNDFGFEYIFERPLKALGSKGDVLICMSTSGKSENIVRVLKLSKKMGIKSISLLGGGGGFAKKHSHINIIVDSTDVARIQEVHIFLGHFILQEVEKKFLKK